MSWEERITRIERFLRMKFLEEWDSFEEKKPSLAERQKSQDKDAAELRKDLKGFTEG